MSTRKTRSGHVFADWDVGTPIVCPVDIVEVLEQRSREIEDSGYASEDDLELEGDFSEEETSGEEPDISELPSPSKRSRTVAPPQKLSAPSSASLVNAPSPTSAPGAPSITLSSASRSQNHRQRSSKTRRKAKRDALLQETGSSVKRVCAKRRSEAQPIYFPEFDAADLPVNSTGFAGCPQQIPKRWHTLESLQVQGFSHYPREGNAARPLVDSKGRMFGIAHCAPRDEENWNREVIQDMAACIEEGRATLTFTEKQRKHKRGAFPAVNVGVGFGGGRKIAGNIFVSKKMRRFMNALLRRRSFQRWSGFMNSAFKTYNEEMYNEYAANKTSLCASDPALEWNFDNSVFAALAVNFSDNVICEDHTDDSNRPDGWCGVTSMGPFDHRKGGQMVLWDLKVILDFPSGTTNFIPSALVRHSNLGIQKGEKRYSVTQYTGGGLFRWVYNGFQSDKEWFAKAAKADVNTRAVIIEQREKDRATRWEKGLQFFPRLFSKPS